MDDPLNMDSQDKSDWITLKIDENVIFYGQIKLMFRERQETPVDLVSQKSPKNGGKSKLKGKSKEPEELVVVRDIYEEYKHLDGKVLDAITLQNTEDVEMLLGHPEIDIVKEGEGALVQYQINEEILSKYEGSFEGNIMKGRCSILYSNNATYEGFNEDGKRHGFGLFQWPSGEKYSGQWVDDKMQGYGVFVNIGGRLCLFEYYIRQCYKSGQSAGKDDILFSFTVFKDFSQNMKHKYGLSPLQDK